MMKNKALRLLLIAFCAVFGGTAIGFTAEKVVRLPAPRTHGGKPLMQALKERSSGRAYSGKPLPVQVLSDLLWAGFGVNRSGGLRTAPSAMNAQEIDLYVATEEGVFLYNAPDNVLEQVLDKDIRGQTGRQEFVRKAAVNLMYVADFSKMEKTGDKKEFYAAMDCGFISENIYLFCASEGLATVARGWFDEEQLKKILKLRPDQKIILTQSVGYLGEN